MTSCRNRCCAIAVFAGVTWAFSAAQGVSPVRTNRMRSEPEACPLHRAVLFRSQQTRDYGSRTHRPVSEADAIAMTLVSGPGASSNYAGTLERDFAAFSPDGSQFAIILKHGNLRANTNDYSLLLYRTAEVRHRPVPVVLVSMSSASNRDAIKDITWLANNKTILFLGETGTRGTQLYSVDTTTRNLEQLTQQPTNLIAYSVDATGRTIVFAAEKVGRSVQSQAAWRGFAVTDQAMADVTSGALQDEERDLYLFRGKGRARQLPTPSCLGGKLWGPFPEFYLSPDGKNLVVKVNLILIPEGWEQYQEPRLHRGITQYRPHGALSWVFRYGVINTVTGKGTVLLDSPVGYANAELKWSPDSRDVVLTGVYLPIQGVNKADSKIREKKTFVVDVDLRTFRYTAVSDEPKTIIGWSRGGTRLALGDTPSETSNAGVHPLCYRKQNGSWEEVQCEVTAAEKHPEITSQQDLNTPPEIVASDQGAPATVLLNLNPELRRLRLATVRMVSFAGPDDHEIRAGLYVPSNYQEGQQYPVVIQTHGFDPTSFWMDGPYPTAFSAQALCSRGMVVLQLPNNHDWLSTPDEAPKMAEILERAVGYLRDRGILDGDRVGVVGFSRTGLHVLYALTHSSGHFRAAIVADGSDGGYSQYLQFLNASPYTASDSEAINGGVPFGPGISSWLERSPEFNLDRVKTPLLVQALGPYSVTFQWATFAALKRLEKPVEFLYLPQASHIVQRPWDRIASQQGAVDWLAFWLKEEEDPDPAKASEYDRWRRLPRPN